jgi:hypothetical protein
MRTIACLHNTDTVSMRHFFLNLCVFARCIRPPSVDDIEYFPEFILSLEIFSTSKNLVCNTCHNSTRNLQRYVGPNKCSFNVPKINERVKSVLSVFLSLSLRKACISFIYYSAETFLPRNGFYLSLLK